MRTITRKIGHCCCMKEWIISGVGAIGEQTADDALRDIERKSRQADSRLSGFNHYKRKRIRFCNVLKQVYSHLPNIAQTAGIVVTNPTTVRVEPTAFRCSTLSRSAKSSAIPAPIIARVAMMNANSGRESWISFTQKSR